jgi:hypothetical protein
MARHHRVTWEPAAAGAPLRSSIGGYPVLPEGEAWPVCAECQQKMALFLQIEVADAFGLPFEAGSVLSVFHCIEHDDPFEDLDMRAPKRSAPALPANYWDHSNYAIRFTSPGHDHQLAEIDPSLVHSRLAFSEEVEPKPKSVQGLNFRDIRVGGSPFWIQKAKVWACSCGSEMTFVASVPGNLRFPRVAGSPKQPNGGPDTYFLFLGLHTYLFACNARCDARAVVAVRQN